jgi:hypothetical protein
VAVTQSRKKVVTEVGGGADDGEWRINVGGGGGGHGSRLGFGVGGDSLTVAIEEVRGMVKLTVGGGSTGRRGSGGATSAMGDGRAVGEVGGGGAEAGEKTQEEAGGAEAGEEDTGRSRRSGDRRLKACGHAGGRNRGHNLVLGGPSYRCFVL